MGSQTIPTPIVLPQLFHAGEPSPFPAMNGGHTKRSLQVAMAAIEREMKYRKSTEGGQGVQGGAEGGQGIQGGTTSGQCVQGFVSSGGQSVQGGIDGHSVQGGIDGQSVRSVQGGIDGITGSSDAFRAVITALHNNEWETASRMIAAEPGLANRQVQPEDSPGQPRSAGWTPLHLALHRQASLIGHETYEIRCVP